MALSVDTPRAYEAGYEQSRNELPVKASTKIYEGAFVGDDASGYARGLVASDPFLGVAVRQADNSAGLAAALNVRLIERGAIEIDVTGVTGPGDVDETIYALDDGTLTIASGSGTAIGKVKRHVSGTKCVVAFEALSARSL
jgi:hypothetical protein